MKQVEGLVARSLPAPVVVDGRHAFSSETMAEHGFRYVGVGIPPRP